MDNLNRLRSVYRQFSKGYEISEAEYVDFDAVRGQSVLDPIHRRFIVSGKDEHVTQLFGGGRGSGKTTELKRFRDQLKDSGFTSVYIDVEETIDVNTCGFGDYLVAIAFGLLEAVRAGEIPGASKTKSYLEEKFEEVRGLFGTRLRLPGFELGAGGAKASFKFEREATPRTALDEELEAITSDATRGVQEMLSKLSKAVKEEGSNGLILLVDGADKISPYPPSDATVEQHVRIFAHRATYLCSLGCHVIYSVPLSFCYSPHAQTFCRTAGVGAPIILPNTTLDSTGKSKEGNDVTGRSLFLQMVELRLKTINESTEAIFAEDALSLTIEQSGGNPNAFITILQESLIRMKQELPLQKEAVEKAVQEMANGMSIQILPEWWDLLKSFKKRQGFPETSTEDFRLCLYFHFVYQYANGEPKFEVNPVLRRLSKMAD